MSAARQYLLICDGKARGLYPSLREALAEAVDCSRVEVYRAEPVLSLTREELAELTAAPAKPARQAGHTGPMQAASAAAAREAPRAPAAVVFDQMFKRFAEVLDRELKDYPLVFHEIIGRGLEKPLRVADRIYQQPARDDYDVLNLLEKLSKEHSLVIFFTGDRKLAAQARALPNVRVEFLPPGEVSGKEMAIKLMKRRIIEALEQAARG